MSSSKDAMPATPEPTSSQPRSFTSLGLSAPLIRALTSLRITTPTPIQAQSIPKILSGRDLIGGSPTGSGKTLSFALPIFQRLLQDMVASFAIVLTPTRELAVQLHEQFLAVSEGSGMGVRTSLVLGGLDQMRQASELQNSRPHIIVATPGRLVDLMRTNADLEWGLKRCKFLVLDEADRLLSPTFGPELAYLFSKLPSGSSRQTLLFTATLTAEIEALATTEPKEEGKQKPVLCRIEGDTTTPPTLRQRYIFVPSHVREPFLYHILTHSPCYPREAGSGVSAPADDSDDDESVTIPPTIIFASRCSTAALLSSMLKHLNLPNVALHSYLSQPERMASLEAFRAQRVPILVTTDVGSRGLDIQEVQLVVNWDLPREWREYVHRVGRTARNGRKGDAVSFVGERDVELVQGIEEKIGVKMTELDLPEEEVLERLNAVSTAKRMASMELHDSKFGQRQERNRNKAAERAGMGMERGKAKAKERREKKRVRGVGGD